MKFLLFYFAIFLIALFADGDFLNKPKSTNILGVDKVVHFFLFFFLNFFLYRVLILTNVVKKPVNFLYCIIFLKKFPLCSSSGIALFFAAISEPLQKFLTTYRRADVFDFFFNTLGIIFFILLVSIFKKTKQFRSKAFNSCFYKI